MSEMVERVARAIWKQERDSNAHAEPFRLSWYEAAARTAIATMREPTREMASAASRAAWHSGSGQDPANICRAMIDAAL